MKVVLALLACTALASAAGPLDGLSCPCKLELVDNQPSCGCEDPCRYGPFCENIRETCECANPCNPEQECEKVGNELTCSCGNPCMTGDQCDSVIHSCGCANPCVSGTCVDDVNSGPTCKDCDSCMTGQYCDTDIVDCTCNKPCGQGEACTLSGDGEPICGCPACKTGDTCDTPIDTCECNNPCRNPDTCVDTDNGAICVCDCIGNEICSEDPETGESICKCDKCTYNKEGESGCESPKLNLCHCNNICVNDQEVCVDGNEFDEPPKCKIGNPSSGNAFTVVFEENHTEKSFREIPLEIYCTPSVPDSGDRFVNLRSAGLKEDHPCYFNENKTIPENSVLRFEVERCMMHNKTGLEKLAIKVIELNNDTMLVYGINKDRWTADGFLAIPDAQAGTHFQTSSYSPAHISTQFAIAALYDDTEVTITLADDNDLEPPFNRKGAVKTFTMNAFETFQVQARCPGQSKSKRRNCRFDLTGSVITSSEPIHVFSGNVRTFIETGEGLSRDHLVEELVPVDRWGKEFGFVSIPGRVVGDLLSVMAVKGETTTVTLYSENFGDETEETFTLPTADGKVHMYKQLPSAQRYFLKSDKPLSVTQLTKSMDTYLYRNESYHDPASITVPPIEQFTNNFFISTPLFTGGENFQLQPYHTNLALLVAENGQEDLIRLDGQPLEDFEIPWGPLPGGNRNNLVAAVIVIPHGTHLINSSEGNFQCLIYGFDDRETYGFPAAMNLKAINN